MNITDDIIDYVEKLARLQLSQQEKMTQKKDMQSIVSYMEVLNTLDTTGVEAMTHIYPIKNVFRKDEVVASYDRELLLENAPEQKDGCYKVPKTVD